MERKQQAKYMYYADYESQPYKVTAHDGDQVVLKSPQGVEYKRNLQHMKPLPTDPDTEGSTESKPNTPAHVPIPESVEPPVEVHVEGQLRACHAVVEELVGPQSLSRLCTVLKV